MDTFLQRPSNLGHIAINQSTWPTCTSKLRAYVTESELWNVVKWLSSSYSEPTVHISAKRKSTGGDVDSFIFLFDVEHAKLFTIRHSCDFVFYAECRIAQISQTYFPNATTQKWLSSCWYMPKLRRRQQCIMIWPWQRKMMLTPHHLTYMFMDRNPRFPFWTPVSRRKVRASLTSQRKSYIWISSMLSVMLSIRCCIHRIPCWILQLVPTICRGHA